MVAAEKKRIVTPEEYLRLERAAEYKSEYYDGEILAMAEAAQSTATSQPMFSENFAPNFAAGAA